MTFEKKPTRNGKNRSSNPATPQPLKSKRGRKNQKTTKKPEPKSDENEFPTEWIGLSPKLVDPNFSDPHENHQDNMSYLLRQAMVGYEDASYFTQNQVKQIVTQGASKETVCSELNDLPHNSITYKMDVSNVSGMLDYEMTAILRRFGWQSYKEAKLRWEELRPDYVKAFGRLSLGKEHPEKRNREMLSEDNELESRPRRLQNDTREELKKAAAEAISSVLIGNARVIGSKVHFLGALETSCIKTIYASLSGEGTNDYLPPETGQITESIIQLVHEQQFVDPQDESRHFLLRKSPKSENFLWVVVLHRRPFPPKMSFKDLHLQPVDSITLWEELPHQDDKTEFCYSNVQINLVLGKIPPKRGTVEVYLTNLKYNKEDYRDYRILIEEFEEFVSASLVIPREGLFEFAIAHAAAHEKWYEKCIKKYSSYAPKSIVPDEAEMSCSIKFCAKYCSICYTTDHSLVECKLRGCSNCGDKSHPRRKCPSKYEGKVLPNSACQRRQREGRVSA